MVIILIYIWWGNISQFSSSSSSYYQIDTTKVTATDSSRIDSLSLEFKPPKLNPFKRPASEPPAANQRMTTPQPTPMKTPKISQTYSIKGFILDSRLPQVILFNNQTTQILAVGDSLEIWTLDKITDSSAIFKHEKEYDTIIQTYPQ